MPRTIRALALVACIAATASSCSGLPAAGSSTGTAAPAPAAAAPAPGAALPPELAELSRMLHASLPGPAVEPTGLIALPKGYPADRALALNRLNQYRVAAGLAPYVYDPQLSVMGQAHTDYLLATAGSNLPSGHFEVSTSKYYTKLGDEAAKTSGISSGYGDPLSNLEGLLAGALHRMQFLRPEESLVGLGFTKAGSAGGGGTVFVTRKAPGASPKIPRFVVFPPNGFDDALTDFGDGEYPEPRPDHKPGDPPTGYPITISLGWDDTKAFQDARVSLKNSRGEELPAWVSFPGKPAVAAPDMKIYSGDAASISRGYRDNFDAVFILPKAPLERGATYSVDAALTIGGKTESLAWSFKTRGARLWTVLADSPDPRQGLEFALNNSAAGDVIELAAGEYELRSEVNLDKAISVIGVPRRTVLRYAGSKDLAAFGFGGDVVLQGIDFSGNVGMYMGQRARVLFEDCRFSYDVDQTSLATCERGSALAYEGCDFSSFASPTLAYFLDSPAQAAAATLFLGPGNKYVHTSYQAKHSYGQGGESSYAEKL